MRTPNPEWPKVLYRSTILLRKCMVSEHMYCCVCFSVSDKNHNRTGQTIIWGLGRYPNVKAGIRSFYMPIKQPVRWMARLLAAWKGKGFRCEGFRDRVLLLLPTSKGRINAIVCMANGRCHSLCDSRRLSVNLCVGIARSNSRRQIGSTRLRMLTFRRCLL